MAEEGLGIWVDVWCAADPFCGGLDREAWKEGLIVLREGARVD